MSPAGASDELLDWIALRVRERRRLDRDAVTTAEAAERLLPSARLTPVERLEIYREQFWLRHTGALATDFPALRALLGRAAWESLSEEYLLRHPPRSPSLRDLGLHLPAHVAATEELPDGPVAAALSTLEWAIVEAFDAADAPALDAARLAAIPAEDWPGLRVRLAPAVRLLELARPVAALREALLAGGAATAPLGPPGPEWLAVHRTPSLDVEVLPLSAPAHALLVALGAGAPLGEAALAAAALGDAAAAELEAHAARWFREFGLRGIVVGVEPT